MLRKISVKAVMSVYDGGKHRTGGNVNAEGASIVSDGEQGLTIINRMLTELQNRGVKPGTNLRITIETVR